LHVELDHREKDLGEKMSGVFPTKLSAVYFSGPSLKSLSTNVLQVKPNKYYYSIQFILYMTKILEIQFCVGHSQFKAAHWHPQHVNGNSA